MIPGVETLKVQNGSEPDSCFPYECYPLFTKHNQISKHNKNMYVYQIKRNQSSREIAAVVQRSYPLGPHEIHPLLPNTIKPRNIPPVYETKFKYKYTPG